MIVANVSIDVEVEKSGDAEYCVTLKSDCFLHGVSLTAKGFLPDDNYFHLPPARKKTIRFSPIRTSTGSFKATIEALNLESGRTIAFKKT